MALTVLVANVARMAGDARSIGPPISAATLSRLFLLAAESASAAPKLANSCDAAAEARTTAGDEDGLL